MKNLKLNESKFLSDFFPNLEETKHYKEFLNFFTEKKLPCILTKKDLPKLKENIKCIKTCFIDDIIIFRSKIKKEEITKKFKYKLDSVEKNYFFFTIGDFSFVLMLDIDLINIENYKENLKKKFQEFQFNHHDFTENDLLKLYNFVNDYNYCFILHKDYEILFIKKNITTAKSNLDFLKIKDLIIAYESNISSLTFELNNRNPENIEQVYNKKNIISEILVVSENLNATSVLIKTEKKKFYCIREKNKISYPKIETREYILFVHNPNLRIEKFCSWFNFEFYRFVDEIFENLPEKVVDIEIIKVIQEINTNERKYKYIEKYYEKPKISITTFDEYYTRTVEIFSETDISTNYSYNFYSNNDKNLAKLIFPNKILQKRKNNLSNFIKIEKVVKNINNEILHKNIKYLDKNNNSYLENWLTRNLPKSQFEKFVLKYVF
ncbi:MAG: hypothetical protein QXR30_03860 [Candidatus Woesearchaeota archaeon]